jgi:hypothetical protein
MSMNTLTAAILSVVGARDAKSDFMGLVIVGVVMHLLLLSYYDFTIQLVAMALLTAVAQTIDDPDLWLISIWALVGVQLL